MPGPPRSAGLQSLDVDDDGVCDESMDEGLEEEHLERVLEGVQNAASSDQVDDIMRQAIAGPPAAGQEGRHKS